MKAVLISIQPKWCELIASGEKTVEVRKNRPKLETPFKVYIYCTKGKGDCLWRWNGVWYDTQDPNHRPNRLDGKVIGEFVCDKIYDIKPHFDTPTFPNQYICGWEYGEERACLSFEELTSYLNGKQGFAWHISDLKIYDKPKELREFRRYPRTEHCGFGECELCRRGDYDQLDDEWFCRNFISKAPQSWCYVED